MKKINNRWIDEKGNSWGCDKNTRKQAKIKSKSLKNCSHCYDCFFCFFCTGCSRCSDCTDCTDCTDCEDCSNCFDCSFCFDCSCCFDLFDCADYSNKNGENIKQKNNLLICPECGARVSIKIKDSK